ncbi:MAG: TRAM domain-containing protein, partial [Lachnospiraceae bacterium]|nr:TRAM domain-containing protein [Lachnospiraceae bacterium]
MKKDDVLIVKIEDISSEGLGVGHVGTDAGVLVDADAGGSGGSDAGAGDDAGFTLFVKDTVIGDVAEVKIVKMKKHYGYARLQRILSASCDRIEVPCPQARRCGGCQIQEMSYEAQLAFKARKVRSNLQRIGGFTEIPMEPILGMEQPFRYRNKAQYPIGRDRDGHLIAGFYAGRTHTVIDCRDCLLGAEVNQTILDIILGHMEACGIEPYDETTGKGLVRHVMIRVGRRALSYRCDRQAAARSEKADWEACADAKGHGAGTEAAGCDRESQIDTAECADGGSDEIMVCIVINGTSLPQSDRLVKALCGISGMTSITLNINRAHPKVIKGQPLK